MLLARETSGHRGDHVRQAKDAASSRGRRLLRSESVDLAAMVSCLGELEKDIEAEVNSFADEHRCECPICASVMRVAEERPLPTIPEMACEVRRLACPSCAMLTERVYHAVFGYAPFPI